MRSYDVMFRATVEAETADDAAFTLSALFLREGEDVSSLCSHGGLVSLDVVGSAADIGPAFIYDSSDLAAAGAVMSF